VIHPEIVESGLASKFKMSPVVDAGDQRAKWLGKTVRFKRGLDWHKYGTARRDYDFVVREVQDDFQGEACVRVYCLGYNDKFGYCSSTKLLEIV